MTFGKLRWYVGTHHLIYFILFVENHFTIDKRKILCLNVIILVYNASFVVNTSITTILIEPSSSIFVNIRICSNKIRLFCHTNESSGINGSIIRFSLYFQFIAQIIMHKYNLICTNVVFSVFVLRYINREA